MKITVRLVKPNNRSPLPINIRLVLYHNNRNDAPALRNKMNPEAIQAGFKIM